MNFNIKNLMNYVWREKRRLKAEEKFRNEEKEFNPFTGSCPDSGCCCHFCNDDACSMCVSSEEKKACGYHACPLA